MNIIEQCKAWWKILDWSNCKNRIDKIIYHGIVHARADQILLFPYRDCCLDHEEIKINKINTRLYNNFLVMDGEFMIKAFFMTHDMMRVQTMVGTFLTTADLPGLAPEMKIEINAMKTDSYFAFLERLDTQTSYRNEVVVEIEYLILSKKSNLLRHMP